MINKELLGEIIDSLDSMIGYADDGTLSRYDNEYKEFFLELDKANNLLNKLNEIYVNMEVK